MGVGGWGFFGKGAASLDASKKKKITRGLLFFTSISTERRKGRHCQSPAIELEGEKWTGYADRFQVDA